jgi:hypothetical protein
MTNIFKKASGAPAPTDKVLDYNFKEHYPDVNRNMEWAGLYPYVRQATQDRVLPWIGEALYEDIAAKVQAGTALTAEQTQLVELLRDSIAYHTIATALPKKKTIVANMGAVENAGSEGSTGQSLWGFRTTLWSVAQDADRHTDRLLAFLEKQVKAGVAYFNLWKNDPTFNAGATDFFRTSADFQAYYNINNSRRTFVAMLPGIQQAARQHILTILGSEQYALSKTAVLAASPSAEDAALVDMIRRALAAWAVYYAANDLPMITDHDGFRVISNVEAIDTRSYPQEVMLAAVERIRHGAEQKARTNTADLVAFLADNAEDYPTWKASSSNPANSMNDSLPFGFSYGGVFV